MSHGIIYRMENRIVTMLIIVAIAATFAVSAAAYPWLPAVMATHWGMHDIANGFMSKGIGVFFIPVMMVGLALLLFWLPTTDPLRNNYAAFKKEYLWLVATIMAFFLALQIAILAWNLGLPFSMSTVVLPSMGLLFFVMGMIMPRLRRNWYVGIRTPWTLSSDAVWTETHKVGGIVFQILGVLMFGILLFPSNMAFALLLGSVVIASLGVVVYSYVVYRHKK